MTLEPLTAAEMKVLESMPCVTRVTGHVGLWPVGTRDADAEAIDGARSAAMWYAKHAARTVAAGSPVTFLPAHRAFGGLQDAVIQSLGMRKLVEARWQDGFSTSGGSMRNALADVALTDFGRLALAIHQSGEFR